MTKNKIDRNPHVLIGGADLIFWDFDGVIKDTLSIKSSAFKKLFLPYGEKIAKRVTQHHNVNAGMSRFEKMPLYLSWTDEDISDDLVEQFCNNFSVTIFQAVVESCWVPGVYEYLSAHYREKYFVLVTATPQDEIERIVSALKIGKFFRKIFGAPMNKKEAIRLVLEEQKVRPECTLMIGDAEEDHQAAESNKVPFMLRRTPFNCSFQEKFTGVFFDNLLW